MANEQYALLKSSNVPTRDQLQQAIDRSGFDLQLYSGYQPRASAGFVPCILNGMETGVEIYFDDSDELIEAFRDYAEDRDCCISFRWGGDIAQGACGMVVSYALAESFGAVVTYEGEPPAETLQELRDETESLVAEATEGA